jgi:histidinol-phosphate aminotransferase
MARKPRPGIRERMAPSASIARLDSNEGRPFDSALRAARDAIYAAFDGAATASIARYPDAAILERAIAAREGISPGRVVVTSGSDDAIARVCARKLAPGAKLLRFDPDIDAYAIRARAMGADVVSLRWDEGSPFPVERAVDIVERCPSLGLVALASPSNPLGLTAPAEGVGELERACARTGVALMLDGAYREFDDEGTTRAIYARAVAGSAAFVLGTFSKAYGLAGMRIGWIVAPDAEEAAKLRAAGSPYPVSRPAIDAALASLADRSALRLAVGMAREERRAIESALDLAGLRDGPRDSRANFAFRRVPDAAGFARFLLERGFAIRAFPNRNGDAVRISCPFDERLLAGLLEAIEDSAHRR